MEKSGNTCRNDKWLKKKRPDNSHDCIPPSDALRLETTAKPDRSYPGSGTLPYRRRDDYSLEIIRSVGALSVIERSERVIFVLIVKAITLIIDPDLISLAAWLLAQWTD